MKCVAISMHLSPAWNPHDFFDDINNCIDIELHDFNAAQISCFVTNKGAQ